VLLLLYRYLHAQQRPFADDRWVKLVVQGRSFQRWMRTFDVVGVPAHTVL
jgi:hypothetical protein